MNYFELAKREGELISLPVEKLHGFATAFDYIATYDFLPLVNKLYNTGVLAPLTLNDNEFDERNANDEYYHNTRCNDIVKTGAGKILNLNAYNIYVRAKYNHDTKKQEEYNSAVYKSQVRLYISKGGVVTGEYIQDCIIKEEVVNEHNFEIKEPHSIPVCIVKKKEETYYVVDHREPKLKFLKEIYEVPVYVDEKVQNMHLNLRSYKKLNK